MTAPPEPSVHAPQTGAETAPETGTAAAPPNGGREWWRPSPSGLSKLALAALITNIAVVATGGLVRLTGSGLGCPSWPTCDSSSFVPTEKLPWNKYVEFGNRVFIVVVFAAALAAFVGVLRAEPKRHDLRPWAWLVFLGVPAQAVMGGVTTLSDLNPWVVASHFLLSMLIVSAATVLWWRTRSDVDPSARPLHPLLRRLALATWCLAFAVFATGTVVTGAGPHAGDPSAPRINIKPASVAQLHADLVMLLSGMAVALAVAVTASGASRVVRLTTRLLVAALAAQAAIGFAQYFDKLPIGLVELHLLGAALIAAAATAVVTATREPKGRGSAVIP